MIFISKKERIATVKDTALDVYFITDEKLAAMPTEDRAQLVFKLCTNGVPPKVVGEEKEAADPLDEMVRVYLASKPDPALQKERDEQRKRIGLRVAATVPELDRLLDDSGKVKQESWDKITRSRKDLQDFLQNVCDAQTATLDMPSIPVIVYEDKDKRKNMGGYNWDVGNIKINMGATKISDFKEALVTILHETFHANQHDLVKKLEAGEIKPGHPLYPTALMFLANSQLVGYVNATKVGFNAYIKQPQELDAEAQGHQTYEAVVQQVLAGK